MTCYEYEVDVDNIEIFDRNSKEECKRNSLSYIVKKDLKVAIKDVNTNVTNSVPLATASKGSFKAPKDNDYNKVIKRII